MRKIALLILSMVFILGCVRAETDIDVDTDVEITAALNRLEGELAQAQAGLLNLSAGQSQLEGDLAQAQQGLLNLSAGQAKLEGELAQAQQGLLNLSAGQAQLEAKIAQNQQGLINLGGKQNDVSGVMVAGGTIIGIITIVIMGLLIYKMLRMMKENKNLMRGCIERGMTIDEVDRVSRGYGLKPPTE